ncbi:hypothetical protein BDQ12DRAFT_731725 [Crucibulum laeve]|uniref:Uncharacterized protein n=1 Tax=Crucibulum laeve TaxID=68775 RepID=A0A5C3MFN7_9AGAR|nr:hypothetical protein BDQ12DRAFT_731725 [Crucibulum laeve]
MSRFVNLKSSAAGRPLSLFSAARKSSRSTKSPKRIAKSMEGCRLPPDLLLEIAWHMEKPRHVLDFCLTSKASYKYLLPALFSVLEIQTVEKCQEQLNFLLRRPCISRHVRKLILRPSHLCVASENILHAENEIIRTVELLAPNLTCLNTFIWDGHERPDDSIWTTLRNSCTKLRYVGTGVGARGIETDSQLFNFSNLKGFIFHNKWRERKFLNLSEILESEPLPSKLWDMLLNRCPDLEELSLGSVGSSMNMKILDIRPLTQGRWPSLQKLSLGHTLMLGEDEELTVEKNSEFSEFLCAHSTLKKLRLPYPVHYPRLDLANSQIQLESYSGSLSSVIGLLPQCQNLKELVLCADEHAAWYVPYIRHILRLLPTVTTLAVWLDLSFRFDVENSVTGEQIKQESDHMVIIRSILAECPQLEHFKVLCSTKRKYGFSMNELSRALVNAPRGLKTLEITKVHTAVVEENMVNVAARTFHQLPDLEKLVLRYAMKPWSIRKPMILRQSGTYETILRENSGHVKLFRVDEIGAGLFTCFNRHYTHSLRPLHRQVTQTVSKLRLL